MGMITSDEKLRSRTGRYHGVKKVTRYDEERCTNSLFYGAELKFQEKTKKIGYFAVEQHAAKAYDDAVRQSNLLGVLPLNFPKAGENEDALERERRIERDSRNVGHIRPGNTFISGGGCIRQSEDRSRHKTKTDNCVHKSGEADQFWKRVGDACRQAEEAISQPNVPANREVS